MRFVGNIVTDEKIEDAEGFNVVKTMEECLKNIPTLIVGWAKMRSIFPNADILDWKINDGIYWTYGKRERRDVGERDILRFYNVAIENFLNAINYVYLNVLVEKKSKIDKFLCSLEDSRKKYVYSVNDMLYICYEGNNNIIGVSLRDMEYVGIDRKEIFNRIYKTENDFILKDISFKVRNNMRNKIYAIPYFFS